MAHSDQLVSSEILKVCCYQDLGQVAYGAAWKTQRELVEKRKAGLIPDHLLFVEHPHVITMGRNAKAQHLLISQSELKQLGIDFSNTDRGGDVTYHGPGQIVAYPIVDLREWKRDVVAYVRSLEQVIIDTMAEFGIEAGRVPGATGVWVRDAKLAAIGVHLSRWVTSHGFALNLSTDTNYFSYIVPCGIQKPATSMKLLMGKAPSRAKVVAALAEHFGRVFDRRMEPGGESS